MYRFVAVDKKGSPTAFAPGVPARDLTDEEWTEFVRAGLIVEGEPTAALWEKASAKDTESAESGTKRGGD